MVHVHPATGHHESELCCPTNVTSHTLIDTILQANKGRDTHMLIQNKYRHYGDVGLSTKRTLAAEDGISSERFRQILKEVFHVDRPGIIKTSLDEWFNGKETKDWR